MCEELKEGKHADRNVMRRFTRGAGVCKSNGTVTSNPGKQNFYRVSGVIIHTPPTHLINHLQYFTIPHSCKIQQHSQVPLVVFRMLPFACF